MKYVKMIKKKAKPQNNKAQTFFRQTFGKPCKMYVIKQNFGS